MNRILLALLLCVTCIITAVAQSYGELRATVEELLSLAEAGDSDAQFQLAETYYYDVVPPDYEAAAKWHAECAKKGGFAQPGGTRYSVLPRPGCPGRH